jgi:dolichyl-diphosphooligosaccharide--protein glycosyltransferase
MPFYVKRGVSGMQSVYKAAGDQAVGYKLVLDVLANGPVKGREILQAANLSNGTVDDWLAFFYPLNPRPVYLYLDWRLTQTSYWWFWFGSWDVTRQVGWHPYYKAYLFADVKERHLVSKGLDVDLSSGEIWMDEDEPVKAKYLFVYDGIEKTVIDFGHEDKNRLNTT